MITQDKIRELSNKYQTTELNVVREYFQHLFLSYFYQQPLSVSVYFKGGTALKIIYKSPRFSEDLDFSAGKIDVRELEQTLLQTLSQIEKENIEVSLKEAKTTSGGYLANIIFQATGFQAVSIQLEVSFRRGQLMGEVTTIASDYIPSYLVNSITQDMMVGEKIQALLSRKKPRDFYDLYFILRSSLLPPAEKSILAEVGKMVKETKINFESELKIFLPKTHWAIIRNFKQVLEREIDKFIA